MEIQRNKNSTYEGKQTFFETFNNIYTYVLKNEKYV